MLALQVDFLTDRIVAKRLEDDEEVEWPPHFARVFYALAAACFEAGSSPAEVDVLKKLETLGPPRIWVREQNVSSRSFEAYVPANDKKGVVKERNPRRFTSAWLQHPTVLYLWPEGADLSHEDFASLQAICSRVAAVGHSSSLVRVLALKGAPAQEGQVWEPSNTGPMVMRVPFPGLLTQLVSFHQRYVTKKALRGNLPAGLQTYRQSGGDPGPTDQQGPMTSAGWTTWTLYMAEGPSMPVLSCVALASALHKAILSLWQTTVGAIPEEISGHEGSGQASSKPHMACFCLPNVGHRYSSGSIMGFGVALPRGVGDAIKQNLVLVLWGLDQLWTNHFSWKLEFLGRGYRSDLPVTVLASRWERPSQVWASVTPVVLDRYPDDPFGSEAEAFVRLSCQRAGLPNPKAVILRPTSVVNGVPPAREFPGYPPGKPSVRVHAVIVFPYEVAGPVLVGRGRYRGMGLFLPLGGEP